MSIFSGNADIFHNDQKEMEKRVCVYHAVVKDYHDDNADEQRAGARRASQFSVGSRQPCLLWRNLCNSLYPGLALLVLFESLIMTISTRCVHNLQSLPLRLLQILVVAHLNKIQLALN